MGHPRHGQRTQMQAAKFDLLCEAARQYAFGACTTADFKQAAQEYAAAMAMPLAKRRGHHEDEEREAG